MTSFCTACIDKGKNIDIFESVIAQDKIKDVLLASFSTMIFLLWKGFLFNTADQTEPLILVYEKLNPALFPGDFYVESAKDIFTVRYFYIQLLSFLGKYFSLYDVSFWLNALCLFASALGLIQIVRKLTYGQTTGYLAPFFVLFIFWGWTIGGNVIQYHLLIASSFAKALSIWGLWFLMDQRWKISAFLIGLGGLFQVLVGLQLAIIVMGVLLVRRDWKVLMQWFIVWLLVIAPMLFPILYRQFFLTSSESVDMATYYHLLYRFRNPQHYLPSLFSLKDFLKLGILFSMSLGVGFYFLRRKVFCKIQLFNAWIILGLILYSVLIEYLGVMAIGKLQWYKTTIWIQASSSLCMAIAVEYLLYRLQLKKIVWIIGMFLPLSWLLKDHYLHDVPLSFDHRTEEQKDLEQMHLWIKENTPQDAMFSTYLNDESFSCEANRPVASMIVPMVHEPWYLISWYDNFYKQYGVKDSVQDLSQTRELANIYYESGQWQDDVRSDYCIMKKGISLTQYSTIHKTHFYQLMKRNG